MATTIRLYQPADLATIVEIINFNILNATSLYDYNTRTLEQQQNIFDDKLSKNFPIIVAEIDGNIAGFGMYAEFRFKEAYQFTVEHSVYVDQKKQGIGVGKLLLNELIIIAKKQEKHTMIGVIDSENQSSIRFHEQFGFEIVGTIKESGYKFDRWLHSVIVQKML